MKVTTKRTGATSTREWELELEDAPWVHFVGVGRVRPHRAEILEEQYGTGRTLTIVLAWSSSKTSASRRFIASTSTALGLGGSLSHISSLPTDLVAELLAACGGITTPEAKEPTS